jgi:hypothetical protein
VTARPAAAFAALLVLFSSPASGAGWKLKCVIPAKSDSVILTSDHVLPVLILADRPVHRVASRLLLSVGKLPPQPVTSGLIGFPLEDTPAGAKLLKLSLRAPGGSLIYSSSISVAACRLKIDRGGDAQLKELHNDVDVLTVGPSRHSAETTFVLGYSLSTARPAFASLSVESLGRPHRQQRFWIALQPGKGALSMDLAALCSLEDYDHRARLSGELFDSHGHVLTDTHVLAVFP